MAPRPPAGELPGGRRKDRESAGAHGREPAAYMQNVLAHWRTVVEEGVYPVPYRVETRLAAVDLEDVAEVAARVLTEEGR